MEEVGEETKQKWREALYFEAARPFLDMSASLVQHEPNNGNSNQRLARHVYPLSSLSGPRITVRNGHAN